MVNKKIFIGSCCVFTIYSYNFIILIENAQKTDGFSNELRTWSKAVNSLKL